MGEYLDIWLHKQGCFHEIFSNVIWRLFNLYKISKYTSFETPTRRMMDVYEELKDIQYTQAKWKCAHMMILVNNNVNNNSNIKNREIQK